MVKKRLQKNKREVSKAREKENEAEKPNEKVEEKHEKAREELTALKNGVKKKEVEKTEILDAFMSMVELKYTGELPTEIRAKIRSYAANNYVLVKLALTNRKNRQELVSLL